MDVSECEWSRVDVCGGKWSEVEGRRIKWSEVRSRPGEVNASGGAVNKASSKSIIHESETA